MYYRAFDKILFPVSIIAYLFLILTMNDLTEALILSSETKHYLFFYEKAFSDCLSLIKGATFNKVLSLSLANLLH